MKKPIWILDKYLLEDIDPVQNNLENMKSALKKCGSEYYVTRYIPFSKENEPIPYTTEDCLVFYGTLGYLMNARGLGYCTGIFCNDFKLKCSKYLTKIDNFLNDDYVLIPFIELRRNPFRFYDLFNTDILFFRPDSGYKSFSGKLLTREKIEKEIDRIVDVGMVNDDDLILISSRKYDIECEARFVIVDKKVVAGSTYRYEGKLDVRSDYFDGAKKVADDMANLNWQPDVCYTCDIALHDGNFKIIELNSFSCAGLYACDLEKVINAVNELRLKYLNK